MLSRILLLITAFESIISRSGGTCAWSPSRLIAGSGSTLPAKDSLTNVGYCFADPRMLSWGTETETDCE